MPVVPNPLPIDTPEELGSDRSTYGRLFRCVDVLVRIARAMLGGRLIEWHVDELIDSNATPIIHNLKRKPFGYIIIRQDANSVPFTNYESWTETTIAPTVAAGKTMFISFILFSLLLAVGAPVAGATECATYGYAQDEPVRFWLCAAAADTTTGAREGDYRYNKATDAFATFDGTVWNSVGGLTVGADDTVPVSDGSAWVPKTLPNTFSNGTVLGYRIATNNFNAEPVYQSVQDEGVALTARGTLNFTGAGVVCVDNGGSSRTDCTIAGGGGGSGNAVEVSVALGTSGGLIFTTTVTGQSWVATSSNIVCTPAATSADGLTVETVYASGVQAVVANKVVGTGFDLAVYSPHGATGTWRFACVGV